MGLPTKPKTRDRAQGLAIEALDPATFKSAIFPLVEDGLSSRWVVHLLCLRGAAATQVPVLRDGLMLCRFEVPCEGDSNVEVTLEWDGDRGLRAMSRHRQILVLPADARHAALPPIYPSARPELDLYFVVDGTTRGVAKKASQDVDPAKQLEAAQPALLLDQSKEWEEHVRKLALLVDNFQQRYSDLRTGVLAFGDREIEGIEAGDMKPKYWLTPGPGSRTLQVHAAERLRQTLLDLRATPGGDFVDALGDALHAVARVGWRPDARKIAVVVGDSPGFSLLQPPPLYSDGLVRRFDVLAEAEALHRQGIELATIYHSPIGSISAEPYLDYAKIQYRRLASHDGYSLEAAWFDPVTSARTIADWCGPIGRGSSPGIFQSAAVIDA